MQLKFFIAIFIVLSGLSAFSAEKAKLSVLSASWEKYTNKDGSGLYFDILDSTIGKDAYSFKLVPWKRAQEEFERGKADLLLGEAADMKYCLYPKWPIDADFFSAYYLKSKVSELPSLSEMAKFRLVWVRGYDIHKFAPELKSYSEVDDLQQGMTMVKMGRADILIDYDQDMKDYLKKNSLDAKEHQVVSTPISGGSIYLCVNPKLAGSREFVKSFDEKMDENFKSGALEKIFKKWERLKNFKTLIERKK
jgi:polar amino acid transport system substrate-binding protein